MQALEAKRNEIFMRIASRELGKPKIMDDLAKYSAMVLAYGSDLIELESIELEIERRKENEKRRHSKNKGW